MLHTFSAEARYVRNLTTGRAAQHLLGSRPFEADLAASHYCAPWYTTAPPLADNGPAGHQAGPWPNVVMLRLIDSNVSSVGNPASTLVLARALHALWPEPEEAIELLASIEASLADRGVVTPAWSLQLDQWEFASAHRFEIDDEDGIGPRPSLLLGWDHPCGDRHGVLLSIDPDTLALHSCCVQPDLDDTIGKIDHLLRGNGYGAGLVEVDASEADQLLNHALARALEMEFHPIRSDEESAGTLALLTSRARHVRAAAMH